MFKSKTVFVVGAGASREAGLPIGSELKQLITDKLRIRYEITGKLTSGDHLIGRAITHCAMAEKSDPNEYLIECWHVAAAMPLSPSIDNYLHTHQGNAKLELCAKMGIVQSILEAESNSLLKVDELNNDEFKRFLPEKIQNTWYEQLFMRLAESVIKNDLDSLFGNISFIVFNYDRCIEHFLYHSVQTYFRASAEDAARLIKNLKITHPYGTVGELPWQVDTDGVPFGARLSEIQLLKMTEQIKTFTEQVEDEDSINAIRLQIQEADTVVFLGFAFHPMNMDLISPEEISSARRAFSTGYGIPPTEHEVIEQDVARALRNKLKGRFDSMSEGIPVIIAVGLSCADFFYQYQRTLSRS
jgi:hypothetical protein